LAKHASRIPLPLDDDVLRELLLLLLLLLEPQQPHGPMVVMTGSGIT
jgi:hypothetical protein